MKLSCAAVCLTAAVLLGGCATSQPVAAPPQSVGTPSSPGAPWVPGPDAAQALDAVWAAAPFKASPATLAKASGGVVARVHQSETLLHEHTVKLSADGRSEDLDRSVWRIFSDGPDFTLTFSWAPWHQARPQVRARVITPDGQETWLDPASIVEGELAWDDLMLSDVRRLTFPLPNARRGAVVELEVHRTTTRPLLDGGGTSESFALWNAFPLRKLRFSLEAPVGTPLQYEAVGIERPVVTRQGDTQRLAFEVGELPFKPFGLTRPQLQESMPRFGFSTASSWEEVARRYRPLLNDAFSDAPDFGSLVGQVRARATTKEKVQTVVRWVGNRVRYTAVHLGDGAIVPTRPSVVLQRGYGDCKDLSVLVASALRQAGVPAEVALAHAAGPAPRDSLPGLESFNHMIVVVPDAGGQRLWVDATAPEYGPGLLPPGVRDQKALIIAEGTTGLSPTTSRADTHLAVDERYELALAPFGAGKGTFSSTRTGAGDGAARARTHTCDGKSAHDLAYAPVAQVFGDVPFTATVTGCELADEAPFTVRATIEQTDLDTGDRDATVGLPARPLLTVVLPDWLFGQRPGAAQASPEQKAERARQLMDETGYREEDLEHRAFSLDSKVHVSRTYRVSLPPHFTVGTLPGDRTLPLGPGTWSEHFTRPDAGTVEARFTFDVTQVDWSQAEVEAFRAAVWARFDESLLKLVAVFEPVKLLEDKRPGEALAHARAWLTETPGDAITRARVARLLLNLGLAELARKELDRAMKDGPDEPLVLMVCGDLARRDASGVPYAVPFDRARAISCLTQAHARLPDHSWPVLVLADLLRRNEQGELERWNPDVERAAKLLEELVEKHRAVDAAAETLGEIYMHAARSEALKRLFEREQGRKPPQGALAVVSDTITVGVDGLLARLERENNPRTQLMNLVVAYSTYGELARYDDARALLTRFHPPVGLTNEFAALQAMNDGARPVPDTVDVKTPEAAARTVVGIFATAQSPTDAARRLKALASRSGARELDGTTHSFDAVRLPSLRASFPLVQLFHRGTCVTAGAEGTFRVRCEQADNRDFALTTYWVTEGGTLKLESLGSPGQLGTRAWEASEKGDLPRAALWVGWAGDEASARQANRGALLRDAWAQTKHDDAAGVRFAAALAHVIYDDLAAQAPAAVFTALETGRAKLSGSLKRRADSTLAGLYSAKKNPRRALEVLRPLAAAENEPGLWLWLAQLELHAGQPKEALKLIDEKLRDDPDSVEWRQEKATALLSLNRASEAFDVLKKLRSDKGSTVDVRNNLLWAQYMAQKLDDEAEREATAMADDKARDAALHTAAMVMLERGRVNEAADYGNRRFQDLDGKMDDAQWAYRARLLQVLGYDDEAKAAWAKVSADDAELTELKRRFTKR